MPQVEQSIKVAKRGTAEMMSKCVERGMLLDKNEDGIDGLVKGLFLITEGELSAAALVGMGDPAIPALRRVLLEGMPSTVYLPRQRVTRVLGELGAFSVLSEYLQREKSIADPELRLAEEAVENTAARELGRSRSEEAFKTLIAVAAKRRLSGAIESLAQFRRQEAAPLLVAALESDFCRSAAVDGIRLVRDAATPYLIESIRSPEPSHTAETQTSLRRRRAALCPIAEQAIDRNLWPSLEFLLHDNDEWLQSLAAEIAFNLHHLDSAIRILLKHLTSDDWVLVDEVSRFLGQHLAEIRPLIDRELSITVVPHDGVLAKRTRLLRWILTFGEKHKGDDLHV
jgi:hypothetical protein